MREHRVDTQIAAHSDHGENNDGAGHSYRALPPGPLWWCITLRPRFLWRGAGRVCRYALVIGHRASRCIGSVSPESRANGFVLPQCSLPSVWTPSAPGFAQRSRTRIRRPGHDRVNRLSEDYEFQTRREREQSNVGGDRIADRVDEPVKGLTFEHLDHPVQE